MSLTFKIIFPAVLVLPALAEVKLIGKMSIWVCGGVWNANLKGSRYTLGRILPNKHLKYLQKGPCKVRRVCCAAGSSPRHGRGAGARLGGFPCCASPSPPMACAHASVHMDRVGWGLEKNGVPPVHHVHTRVAPKPGGWDCSSPRTPAASGGLHNPVLPVPQPREGRSLSPCLCWVLPSAFRQLPACKCLAACWTRGPQQIAPHQHVSP